MSHDPAFVIIRALPLPGLGLLVLPRQPAPAWLAAPPLHAALQLQLHRPGQPPLPVPATVEEITLAGTPPARALLLDADPGGELPAGAWLELLAGTGDGLRGEASANIFAE